jgi:hypothetical protein
MSENRNEATPAAPDNRALLIFCAVPSWSFEICLPLAARRAERDFHQNRPKQVRLKKGGKR